MHWSPRVITGLSAVTIRSVVCGETFGACLSDRGILMTFGSGAHGALGHRNYEDVEHPKIVESLLGSEVKKVRFLVNVYVNECNRLLVDLSTSSS